MNYLVKFQADCADEFDVFGFAIVSKAVFDFKMRVAELFWNENPGREKEFGFGSNEYLTYSSYNEFLETLNVTEISDEEIATFRKFFGNNYNDQIDFGHNEWIDFDDYLCEDIENLSPLAVKELNALAFKAYPDGGFTPYESNKVDDVTFVEAE